MVSSSPEIQLFMNYVNVLIVLHVGLVLGQTFFRGTVIRLVRLQTRTLVIITMLTCINENSTATCLLSVSMFQNLQACLPKVNGHERTNCDQIMITFASQVK